MTTKPPLQKILQGILHTEDENKQTMKEQEILNHKKEKTNTQRVALSCT
jgi:hypothetical protein